MILDTALASVLWKSVRSIIPILSGLVYIMLLVMGGPASASPPKSVPLPDQSATIPVLTRPGPGLQADVGLKVTVTDSATPKTQTEKILVEKRQTEKTQAGKTQTDKITKKIKAEKTKDDQTHKIATNQCFVEVGTLNVLDTAQAQRAFMLHNTTQIPMVIERLQLSCGCLSVLLPPPSDNANPKRSSTLTFDTLPVTLAPGEKRQVIMTVNLSVLPSGPFSKSVSVFVKGDTRSVALLTLSGSLQSNVTLLPAVLDFGKVAVGGTRALIVTATFSDRLAAEPLPRLVCHNADVQITPVLTPVTSQPRITLYSKDKSTLRQGANAAVPAFGKPGGVPAVKGVMPGGNNQATSHSLPGAHTQLYRVTLRATNHLGTLTETLGFVADARSAAANTSIMQPAKPILNMQAALRQSTVMLVGQVVGDITPQPPILAFGSIMPGQVVTRQIVLRGERLTTLHNLQAISDSPWITVHLSDSVIVSPLLAAGSAAQPTLVLDVTLAAATPPGLLQSQVVVTLVGGQRLIVPVQAYILAKAP